MFSPAPWSSLCPWQIHHICPFPFDSFLPSQYLLLRVGQGGLCKVAISLSSDSTPRQRESCTPVFIATLYKMARTWKQLKWPSAEEWIKMWYIYTMKYYSVIKGTKLHYCSDMDRLRVCHAQWSQSEKQISYINSYMWNLEKWYLWTCLQVRNRDAGTEWACGHGVGEVRKGWIERVTLTYKHYHV